MEWTRGMDSWNGLVEWTRGMDLWNGLVEWHNKKKTVINNYKKKTRSLSAQDTSNSLSSRLF